jgi:hypothetical protein
LTPKNSLLNVDMTIQHYFFNQVVIPLILST